MIFVLTNRVLSIKISPGVDGGCAIRGLAAKITHTTPEFCRETQSLFLLFPEPIRIENARPVATSER
jgi:hypothetical protein